MIIMFALQLTIYDQIPNEEVKQSFKDWLNENSLGIRRYDGDNFIDGLKYYYPQIFLLLSVLIHVQKESRLGVFGIPYE